MDSNELDRHIPPNMSTKGSFLDIWVKASGYTKEGDVALLKKGVQESKELVLLKKMVEQKFAAASGARQF